MNSKRKVIIVGAGVNGLCTGYELILGGADVTILEANSPSDFNCSFINAGMIVPSHFIPMAAPGMLTTGLKMMLKRNSPLRIAADVRPQFLKWCALFARNCTQANVDRSKQLLSQMHMASRKRYLELETELDHQFKIHQNGLFMFCSSEKTLHEEAEIAKLAQDLGIRAETIDRAELKQREPNLEIDVLGAVHHLDDCHFEPGTFMNCLKKRFTGLGGKIESGASVSHLDANKSRIVGVETSTGKFEGDDIVICGGVWSGHLTQNLGVRIPLAAGKGYSFMAENGAQYMNACGLLMEAKVALTPMGTGLRIAGTMEVALPEENGHLSMNQGRIESIRQSTYRYLPIAKTLISGHEKVSAGLRPMSPDGIPFVGKVEPFENLWVSTGHGMMGMSLGPASGQILARQITQSSMGAAQDLSSADKSLLSPNRFFK